MGPVQRPEYRDLISTLTGAFSALQSAERRIQRLPVSAKRSEVLEALGRAERLLNELDGQLESES